MKRGRDIESAFWAEVGGGERGEGEVEEEKKGEVKVALDAARWDRVDGFE